MVLKAGRTVELTVMRESSFGYFLSDGIDDCLLHRQEMTTDHLKIGQKLSVFIYTDKEGRIAATMNTPLLQEGETGWLRVVDLNPRLGAFLDLGIQRNVLLPRSEFPKQKSEWPQIGDKLYVHLTRDNQGRMLTKLADPNQLVESFTPGKESVLKQNLKVTVFKQFAEGALLYSEEGYLLYLGKLESGGALRLGQELVVRATYIHTDGRMSATLRPQKEKAMGLDADKVLQILQDRKGAMPYGDQTEAEQVRQVFGMSKAAFKRALGKLMKEGKIVQKDGWTYQRNN